MAIPHRKSKEKKERRQKRKKKKEEKKWCRAVEGRKIIIINNKIIVHNSHLIAINRGAFPLFYSSNSSLLFQIPKCKKQFLQNKEFCRA